MVKPSCSEELRLLETLVPLNNYQGELKLCSGSSLSLRGIRYATNGRVRDIGLPKLFVIKKKDSETQPYDTELYTGKLWFLICFEYIAALILSSFSKKVCNLFFILQQPTAKRLSILGHKFWNALYYHININMTLWG